MNRNVLNPKRFNKKNAMNTSTEIGNITNIEISAGPTTGLAKASEIGNNKYIIAVKSISFFSKVFGMII